MKVQGNSEVYNLHRGWCIISWYTTFVEERSQQLVLKDITLLVKHNNLLAIKEYVGSMRDCIAVLSDKEHQCSGIVTIHSSLPTIIVPDLHARPEFILKVLEFAVGQKTILTLLQEQKVNVIFLGDIAHSEDISFWVHELPEGKIALKQGDELLPEMIHELTTIKILCDIKSAFPGNVHILRGNHDDVRGRIVGLYMKGMIPQSQMVLEWLVVNFGREFIDLVMEFEDCLALIAEGDNFMTSHSAPGRILHKEEVKNKEGDVAEMLTWTENREEFGGLRETELKRNICETWRNLGKAAKPLWVAGHRTVEEPMLYREQAGGIFVQINNPTAFIIGIIPANKMFDAEKHIQRLE